MGSMLLVACTRLVSHAAFLASCKRRTSGFSGDLPQYRTERDEVKGNTTTTTPPPFSSRSYERQFTNKILEKFLVSFTQATSTSLNLLHLICTMKVKITTYSLANLCNFLHLSFYFIIMQAKHTYHYSSPTHSYKVHLHKFLDFNLDFTHFEEHPIVQAPTTELQP